MQPRFFHGFGNAAHLIKRRSNKTAYTNYIDLFPYGGFYDCFGWNHDAEIDNVIVVATEYDGNDVFSYVMYISFDRSQEKFTIFPGTFFLYGNIGLQNSNGLFHGTSGFYHLRKKHFSFTEKFSYSVHSIHQRPFDDFYSVTVCRQGFMQVGIESVDRAFDESVFEPFVERHFVAYVGLWGMDVLYRFVFERFRSFYQPFGCVGASVEDDIFDTGEQFLRNICVCDCRCRIDDGHVHSCTYSMEQKDSMHGFAYIIVSSE